MKKIGIFLLICCALGILRGFIALGSPQGENYYGPIFFSAFFVGGIGLVLYCLSDKTDTIYQESNMRQEKEIDTNNTQNSLLDELKEKCNPSNVDANRNLNRMLTEN